MKIRRAIGWRRLWLVAALLLWGPAGAAPSPVKVALIAEYGVKGSHAAQSIERGIRIAVDEINRAGGVLGGRPLEVVTRDDRGLPARAIGHLEELARDPDVVASFCGRMSPVAVALVPVANRLGIPLLDAWAAADGIADNGAEPNYVYRLSLTDTWAMEAMLRHARERGLDDLAVMLPNTAWGRSNQAALENWVRRQGYPSYKIIGYNWGDTTFADKIARVQASDMDAVLLIANEAEGAFVVQEMAALPEPDRLPLIAHWGITGGDFATLTGPALGQVDLVVIQSFSFHNADGPRADAVAAGYRERYGTPVETLHAQVGFAHAYDFTHLLALAIERAGSADRAAVRAALERLPGFSGLVREYVRPFGPDDHEALDAGQVALARFRPDGTLELVNRHPEH